MSHPILITGATGNVGQELVRILHEQDVPVRATMVSEKNNQPITGSVSWHRFDFTDVSTYASTFNNVKKMFLMRPPHITNIEQDMKPAIEYAIQAGVEHIVFLSLMGADKNRFVPHAKVEKLLQQSSVNYTLLRCGFFMQNLSTTHRQDIQKHDDIFIPAGNGKTAFIDTRDIAAVAAKTLTEANHENKIYPLTGHEALNYYQVANIMTDVFQRPIHYSNPSVLHFVWRLWRRGYHLSYITVVAAIYLTTRFGLAETITPHTEQLLGRKSISMKQFVQDHISIWENNHKRGSL